MKWSENVIATALARQTFRRKHLILVPNCSWPGSECDLLVVTTDLRVIDVEVKISRSDLKADAKKDKWWQRGISRYCGDTRKYKREPDTQREWPRRVWKHYYAMPADIWEPGLESCLPSPASGVVLLEDAGWPNPPVIADVVRRAQPNRKADRLTPGQAIDVARLANLRLWDAYEARDNAIQEADVWREKVKQLEIFGSPANG